MRVCSYNLRMDNKGDGKNAFSADRKNFILETFPRYGADLIGFQEVLPHMRQWLLDAWPEYQICGVGRGADLQDESNVIAFRRDRFDLIDLHTFWLSDTPQQPGSRFSTDQSCCPRICTCAALYDRKTGRSFRHYNTHLDHEGAFAQAQGISLILGRIAADDAVRSLPVILTGDFNVTPDSVVCHSVENFTGCGEPLHDATSDIPVSFHAYHPEQGGVKIDYIFTNLPASGGRAAEDVRDGVYLSDHYPVYADLTL